MTRSKTELELVKRLQPEVLGAMIHWLDGERGNLTGVPLLRPSLTVYYPAVLAIYSVVLVAAVLANCCLVVYAYRHRLYLLLNLVFSNLLLSCPMLPPTVAVLIFQDWLLGRTACLILPLVQEISLHLTVLSHLALAVDRYREIQGQPRLSPIAIFLGTWCIAVLLVLPYRSYITYTDLAVLGSQFIGLGVCTSSLTDHIREYIRSVILLAYFLPVCIMFWVYLRMRYATLRGLRRRDQATEHRTYSVTACGRGAKGERTGNCHSGLWRINLQQHYAQVQHLGVMLAVCNVCLCPLMVFRVIKTHLMETPQSSDRFDLLYCGFVLLAFVPTLTSPLFSLYSEYRKSTAEISGKCLHSRGCSGCKSSERRTSWRAEEAHVCSLSRASADPGHSLGVSCV